jgi:hypothetical protein
MRPTCDHETMWKRSPSKKPFGQSSARMFAASSGLSSRPLSLRVVLCLAASLGLAKDRRNCDGDGEIGGLGVHGSSAAGREDGVDIASVYVGAQGQEAGKQVGR